MKHMTLEEVSAALKNLDYCMFVTMKANGVHVSRPMSNNRDVKYSGENYFFTSDETSVLSDLEISREVNLAYQGNELFISVSGKTEILRDQTAFEKHWRKSLDKWYPEGPRTKGLALIRVKAHSITVWKDNEEFIVDCSAE